MSFRAWTFFYYSFPLSRILVTKLIKSYRTVFFFIIVFFIMQISFYFYKVLFTRRLYNVALFRRPIIRHICV